MLRILSQATEDIRQAESHRVRIATEQKMEYSQYNNYIGF